MKPRWPWKGVRAVSVLLLVCAALSGCSRTSSSPVDEGILVDVGDTRVFAEIRGNDSKGAALLLYLHGGPGSPLGVPVFRAYGGRLLEENRIVVYLHQRGIAKSPRVPDENHRIARYVEDVHRVIGHLRNEFSGREIDVLGHSWGGVLALLHLAEHPESIRRLVLVSTPITVETMVRGRVERVLRWGEESGNEEAVRDLTPLRRMNPIDDADEFEVLAKWTTRAYGGWHRNLSRERLLAVIDDVGSFAALFEEQEHIEELMRDEVLRLDLSGILQEITIPLLSIVGRDDVDVPWEIVREELADYGGPVDFRVFDDSHHMPFIDQEALFVETVERFLDEEDTARALVGAPFRSSLAKRPARPSICPRASRWTSSLGSRTAGPPSQPIH